MSPDKSIWMEILTKLAEINPQPLVSQEWKHLYRHGEETLFVNLEYLDSHGLIHSGLKSGMWNVTQAKITPKGHDYLASDGGLSAELGVITIKIHTETIRALIEAKIMGSNHPAAEKKRIIDHLRALPEKSFEELTKQLIHHGVNHIPDIYQWLRTTIGS